MTMGPPFELTQANGLDVAAQLNAGAVTAALSLACHAGIVYGCHGKSQSKMDDEQGYPNWWNI